MKRRFYTSLLVACAAIVMSCENEPTTILQPRETVPPPPPAQPSVSTGLDVRPQSRELLEAEVVYLSISSPSEDRWMSSAGIKITWSSSDTSVATVNKNWQVEAIAPGTAKITGVATVGDSMRTGFMTVSVKPATVSDGAIITAGDHGWQPSVAHVSRGSIVEWRPGARTSVLYLMDVNLKVVDSVDLKAGVPVVRQFKEKGVIQYCSGICWDPPDWGTVYIH